MMEAIQQKRRPHRDVPSWRRREEHRPDSIVRVLAWVIMYNLVGGPNLILLIWPEVCGLD